MAVIRLWLTLLAMVMVGTVLSPRVAHADSEAQQQAKARARIKKARAYYEAGKFDQAVAEYIAAYKLIQLSDILFNVGQIYEVKGEAARALDFYLKYLGTDPDGRLHEEAKTRTATLAEECLPESLRPRYKEAVARRTSASASDKPALEEKWSAFYGKLAGGERDGLEADLAELSAKPKVKVALHTSVEPEPEPMIVARPARSRRPLPPYARKWWFWTAIGGGAAVVLIVGLGAGLGAQPSDPRATIGVLK